MYEYLTTDEDLERRMIRGRVLSVLEFNKIRDKVTSKARTAYGKKICSEMTAGKPADWGSAWEEVTRAIRKYGYSEQEKADILAELDGQKVSIQRSKGLGENDPEMMWLTTMNPETRRLIKVMPEDAERTAAMFDLLLGDDLTGRKNHIAENGSRFLDLADIS